MHISIWMEWKDLDLATVEEGQAVEDDTALIEVMEGVGKKGFYARIAIRHKAVGAAVLHFD